MSFHSSTHYTRCLSSTGSNLPVGNGVEADSLRVTLASDSTGVVSLSAVDSDKLSSIATNTTGASTAAKQPALGTSGTASTDVITIQGIASMTPIDVSGTVELSAIDNAVLDTIATNTTGASTAAKQPALGTSGTASTDVLTVQGIASMTALVVDGSAVTQPVSGTVNLSAVDNAVLDTIATNTTGASTEAKQPALGTSGTASTDVLTVQGIASMTALVVDGSAVTQPVSGTVNLSAVDNAVLDTIATNTTGLNSCVSIAGDTLQVDVVTTVLPTGASTAAKQPALGTSGTASTDVITVQGIASMTALIVDGSANTQPVSGTVTANLGTSAVLDTIASSIAPIGAHSNMNNAYTTVGTTSTSNAIDIQYVKNIQIFGNFSSALNATIQISQNNSVWYSTAETVYTAGVGDFVYHSSLPYCARYVRLLYDTDAVVVTVTCAGK